MAFLRSIEEHRLQGVGLALTLTIRSCPPTPEAWARLIELWVKRQRRGGCSVLHWVMEFQRRGVPHLHVAAWYDPEGLRPATVEASRVVKRSLHSMHDGVEAHRRAAVSAVFDWLQVAEEFEPEARGQHAKPIVGPVGWFVYLGKHCGRGRAHYQRQQKAMPKPWASAPRAWGKSGSWPLQAPQELVIGSREFHRLRRLVRRQRVARARAAVPGPGWAWHALYAPIFSREQTRGLPITPKIVGDAGSPLRTRLRHLQQARRMLKCPLASLSAVRGVSEWIDPRGQIDLLRALGRTHDDLQDIPEPGSRLTRLAVAEAAEPDEQHPAQRPVRPRNASRPW